MRGTPPQLLEDLGHFLRVYHPQQHAQLVVNQFPAPAIAFVVLHSDKQHIPAHPHHHQFIEIQLLPAQKHILFLHLLLDLLPLVYDGRMEGIDHVHRLPLPQFRLLLGNFRHQDVGLPLAEEAIVALVLEEDCFVAAGVDLVPAGLEVEVEAVLKLQEGLLEEVGDSDVGDEVEFLFFEGFAVDALMAIPSLLFYHICLIVVEYPLLRLLEGGLLLLLLRHQLLPPLLVAIHLLIPNPPPLVLQLLLLLQDGDLLQQFLGDESPEAGLQQCLEEGLLLEGVVLEVDLEELIGNEGEYLC